MCESASVGISAAARLTELRYSCPQCTELMREQCLSSLLEEAVEFLYIPVINLFLHPSN